MKVEWFRSATVGVSSEAGSTILCDPWMTDGAFLGSWYHFPPLEGFEYQELLARRWDAVYISHIHADHFDRKFVAELARTQPNCVAIIPRFAHDWLRRAVENCGFSGDRLVAVESGKSHRVGDLTAKIFVADHCDPSVCGVSIPCHNQDPRMASFDSLAVFEADDTTILNANDALAIKSVANVLPSLGRVDLLMGHYGGAGPFPQCFADLADSDKKTKGRMLAEGFLHRLSAAAKTVKARYVMPFAGQYVLGGRLSELNQYRSVVPLSEALDWVANTTESTPIAMAPFSSFDLSTGMVEKAWEEPSSKDVDQYMSRIAEHSFPYEKAPVRWANSDAELRDALEGVAAEYHRRLSLGEATTTHRISVVTSTVSGFIDFRGESTLVEIGPVGEMLNSETRLTCHPNLLKGLIQRADGFSGFTPMHFNQAEIGSHFEWRRTGDFNEVVRCLNFMQVGSGRRLDLVRT